MIQSENLTKRFNNTLALDSLTTSIEDGKIYGLVGSNGAGKSTFLRLLAGVYRPTEGRIMINGEDVYENPALKSELFFIPDEIYQMPGASMDSLAKIYSSIYPNWSASRYAELVKRFPIPPERKLSACSKGMRRQIAIILGLSCMPKYLLLDEAFDGLDPVIRVAVRKIIADDILDRGTTVLIASHTCGSWKTCATKWGCYMAERFYSRRSLLSFSRILQRFSLLQNRCRTKLPLNSWLT